MRRGLVLTLNEIGMVAADTSRTFYYLEGLIRHKLHPSHVLLLINNREFTPRTK